MTGMAYVFISSRMSELEAERLAAFHACHRLGHRPMMFEMQPTDDGVAPAVDYMVGHAKFFIGIVRNTLGPTSYDLHDLPPILYELGLFISKQCRRSSGHPECLNEPGKRDCLATLHGYLRGRYLPGDEPRECANALENARGRLFMFAAEPREESEVSTQVQALVAQLQAVRVPVTYFRNRFELFAKIVELDPLKDVTGGIEVEDEVRYAVTYEGRDYPGQVYQLAMAAFSDLMNIEHLFVQTEGGSGSTYILALVAPYAKLGKARWTEESLKERFVRALVDDARAAAGDLEGGRWRRFQKARTPQEKTADYDEGSIFCERGFSVWKADPMSEAGARVRSEEDRHRKLDGSLRECGKPHVRVRIYHLNVPGIIARMSQMLAGKSRIFPHPLNIESCAMQAPELSSYLGPLPYGDAFNEFESVSQNLHGFQVCDLLLTDAAEAGSGLGAKGSAGIYELENALSSIAGVDYVVCSDWVGFREPSA